MQRLSGIDSMFLSLESPTNLFQVGAVSVIDPSTAPAGSPRPTRLCAGSSWSACTSWRRFAGGS